MREIKMKSSVIVKGLDAPNVSQFRNQFLPVAQYVLGSNASVNISDVVCISAEKKLFRFKMDDQVARADLLRKSSCLKNSIFSGIFINRDLTYVQRKELFKRRQDRRSDVQNNAQLVPNDAQTNSATSTLN